MCWFWCIVYFVEYYIFLFWFNYFNFMVINMWTIFRLVISLISVWSLSTRSDSPLVCMIITNLCVSSYPNRISLTCTEINPSPPPPQKKIFYFIQTYIGYGLTGRELLSIKLNFVYMMAKWTFIFEHSAEYHAESNFTKWKRKWDLFGKIQSSET